jgi:hypothetical protein
MTDRWRCTNCKRERVVADALPPLTRGLSDKYRAGRCKKCRAYRTFEPVKSDIWDGQQIIPAGQQDGALGDRLKEKGMGVAEQAEAMTGSDWNSRADAVIRSLALARHPFTSEDVTERVGLPRSSGAVGARMNAASRRGVIKWTGRMASANRPNQHSALLKVWQG